jgi:hypothetical protein
MVFVHVDGGNVHHLFDLICKYIVEPRMAMTNIDCRYSTSEIKKLSACVIIQVLTTASHCKKGLLVVGFVEWEHVLLMEFQCFISAHALEGFSFN